MPEDFDPVTLHDVHEKPCGCTKLIKDTTDTSLCDVHGGDADAGAEEMVQALRERFKGRLFLEVPGWSHVPAGRQMGRRMSGRRGGQLRAGPDMHFDIVLERYEGAIHELVPAGMKSENVIAVELNGPEHKQKKKVKRRDKSKKGSAPVAVLPVNFFEEVPEKGDAFWQEEADKVLSRWPEVQ